MVKIPWPIVQRLRRNLSTWITTAANPFDQDIEVMILEVASEFGAPSTSPEEAWKKMGGRLFTDKQRKR